MKTNAHDLALRDPAAAALFGLIPETDFGSDYGSDFGADFGADFGDDDYGADFGDDDYGADAPAPNQQQLMALWNQRHKLRARGQHRTLLLDPNRGSATKVEKYILALSDTVDIGTMVTLSLEASPDCTFRPQRFTMTVPTPNFFLIADIKMANVSVNIGPGSIDAFQFNPNGVGQHMDLPTLTPANRARVTGNYTGFGGGFSTSPPTKYLLSATFIGPSSLAGGSAV